jgi:hypothetical protein
MPPKSAQNAGIRQDAMNVLSTRKEVWMRGVTNYQVQKESFDDMHSSGRFNPSLEVTFRDKTGIHTHKISAGHSDDIDVYRESRETYVLSRNLSLGYVGLEVFTGADAVGDMFLQGDQVDEILGRDDLAPFTIIKRMREYIC